MRRSGILKLVSDAFQGQILKLCTSFPSIIKAGYVKFNYWDSRKTLVANRSTRYFLVLQNALHLDQVLIGISICSVSARSAQHLPTCRDVAIGGKVTVEFNKIYLIILSEDLFLGARNCRKPCFSWHNRQGAHSCRLHNCICAITKAIYDSGKFCYHEVKAARESPTYANYPHAERAT